MLVGAAMFFVNGTDEGRPNTEFFEEFTLGGGKIGFVRLDFSARCNPEDEWAIATLSDEANEKQIAGLVEEEDASGAA
jgi:hypothetical protein